MPSHELKDSNISTNLTAPISGSQDDREVTVTINSVAAPGDPGTLGKIVVGFTLDWSMSGNDYTFSSDDSSLDITYTQYDNSSVTVNMANAGTADNLLTITNDGLYGGNSTLNIDALSFITHLNATGDYLFTDLESRFALPNTTLEVNVDVSNLNVYNSVLGSDVNNITATIDIV